MFDATIKKIYSKGQPFKWEPRMNPMIAHDEEDEKDDLEHEGEDGKRKTSAKGVDKVGGVMGDSMVRPNGIKAFASSS